MGKIRKNQKKRYQRDYRKNVYNERIQRRKRHYFAKRPLLLDSKVFKDSALIRDDRRRFRPDHGLPLSVDGRSATTTVRSKDRLATKGWSYEHVYFKNPKRVRVCKRRKVRKEVLFAKRKIGKGKRVTANRRYNELTQVRC